MMFKIERKLKDYDFYQSDLLSKALTRKSAYDENLSESHNERLEFLGDAILRHVVELFYATHFCQKEIQGKKEDLASYRDSKINTQNLAKVADTLGLFPHIIMGRGEKNQKHSRIKVLGDCFEALVAAIYIDSAYNFTTVQSWVIQNLGLRGERQEVSYYTQDQSSVARAVLPYVFKNDLYWDLARTRKSYNENQHNEILTLLGDGLIRLVVSEHLYIRYPDKKESELSQCRDAMVTKEAVYKVSVRMFFNINSLSLKKVLRMDSGEIISFENSGKQKICSDTVKAIIAAVMLDSSNDYLCVKKIICRHWQLQRTSVVYDRSPPQPRRQPTQDTRSTVRQEQDASMSYADMALVGGLVAATGFLAYQAHDQQQQRRDQRQAPNRDNECCVM